MRYDFDTILDRRAPDAVKWAVKDGELPMWVADMDFRTAPEILEALQKRLDHGVFGYSDIPEDWYRAYADWWGGRHGLSMEKGQLTFCTGVVPALSSIVRKLTTPNENVLIQTPVYNVFWNSIENNGRRVLESPLRYEGGAYFMDLEDLERKIVENRIHATIFCNPHNPCGRVWEADEIRRAMEIFEKHRVWVISDEIWSDILLDGHRHIPAQSVSEYAREHTAAFYAPSKTFNLAGLVGSYHIIYSDWLRERQAKEASLCEYNTMNVLSMHALLGAYTKDGAEWVEELRETLEANVRHACEQIGQWPGISVQKPQGTYMLFLQCEAWCRAHGKTLDDLLKMGTDVGVAWQDGRLFGDSWGIRMNLTLPLTAVKEAFDRLNRYVFAE